MGEKSWTASSQNELSIWRYHYPIISRWAVFLNGNVKITQIEDIKIDLTLQTWQLILKEKFLV